MVLRSAQAMRAVLPRVLAVVRETDAQVLALLEKTGCEIVVVPSDNAGMGESIAAAVAASGAVTGWLIALGDMPYIDPSTIEKLAQYPLAPEAIVVPSYLGQRGHPVLFGGNHRDRLASLRGDTGGRSLLQETAVVTLEVGDPGILRDVDTPDDLA